MRIHKVKWQSKHSIKFCILQIVGGFSISIEGAPEVLNKIYNDAKSFVKSRNKQYRSEGSEEFGEVSLKNNTVKVQYYNIGS